MATPKLTHASQLVDEDETYCTRDAVLQLLAGINRGTVVGGGDGDPLANLGDEAARNALIDLWLPVAAEKVRQTAKQGFGYYEEETLYINGAGTDRLDLKDFGIPAKRIIEVTALVVDDVTVSDDAYYVTGDGWLIYTGELTLTDAYPTLRRGGPLFPHGFLNVAVTMTWGYEEVPANIATAAALFVCAYIIPFAEAFDSNTDDDLAGGDINIQMGDMRVTQKATESRYSRFVRHCYTTAVSLCQNRAPRVRAALVDPELAT